MWLTAPHQAWCSHDDCSAVMWDMTGDPATFKATAEQIDLEPFAAFADLLGIEPEPEQEQGPGGPLPPGPPGEQAAAEMGVQALPTPDAGAVVNPVQVALAELADANREMALRAMLHARGFRCAAGCGVCDPNRPLSGADELRVRSWARALLIAVAADKAAVQDGKLRLLIDPVAALYGAAGLHAIRDEVTHL